MMHSRDNGKNRLNEISSYNPYTRYRVDLGILHVSAPGGLADEQKFLLTAHKMDIMEYLTTPPAIKGDCCKGHPIAWTCSPYGLWVCRCYYTPYQFNSNVSNVVESSARAANR